MSERDRQSIVRDDPFSVASIPQRTASSIEVACLEDLRGDDPPGLSDHIGFNNDGSAVFGTGNIPVGRDPREG